MSTFPPCYLWLLMINAWRCCPSRKKSLNVAVCWPFLLHRDFGSLQCYGCKWRHGNSNMAHLNHWTYGDRFFCFLVAVCKRRAGTTRLDSWTGSQALLVLVCFHLFFVCWSLISFSLASLRVVLWSGPKISCISSIVRDWLGVHWSGILLLSE